MHSLAVALLLSLALLGMLVPLGTHAREAGTTCTFDPRAILQLAPSEQCAVHALSETCNPLHHCHASCLVGGTGRNVGGGCAHLCGLVERSHAYYDCYPGSRDEMDAMMTYFVISNESDEEIRVALHYRKAPNHDVGTQAECLDVDLKLAPREQLGQDSYLVDENRRLLVEPLEPKLRGTAQLCSATVAVPPGKLLLHRTSYGYWFSELHRVHVRGSSGSYSFSHSEVRGFDAPAESVYRWFVWRHPYHRTPWYAA